MNIHPLLLLTALLWLGSGALLASEHPQESPAPEAHSLARYGELWDSGWFVAPQEVVAAVTEAPIALEPFLYRLVGVADLRGRQWVYLADESGRIVELTFGRPVGDLSLVRIEAAEAGSAATVVRIRKGGRLIPLELLASLHPAPTGGSSAPGVEKQILSRPSVSRRLVTRGPQDSKSKPSDAVSRFGKRVSSR